MINLPGYTIIQQIYEGSDALIYRGYRDSDREPIVAKLLKGEFPKGKPLASFKLEYKLLKKLQGVATVKTYELIPYENSFVIIMENFGIPLTDLLAKGLLSTQDFLTIAIKITTILEIIHSQHVMHKDLNPNNILWDDASKTIKIIDFGISSTIAREEPELPNLQILEGSLPYLSPEQTGRMNRGVDYHTDFYSLGIIFYEMVTGKKPFDATDPLQIIHAHIAKLPTPPHEVNPAVPKVISDIILKLMAKNAEDRYQSTFGLKADLQKCLDELNYTGKIKDFPIASQDVPAQLTIPEKLYGREEELQLLLDSFERVCAGSAELMLVMGHPGVGKSRLIFEIQKTIVEKNGYFISGKFEQFTKNLPYSSLIQAFKALVQQMLGESDESIKRWREQILTALGPNGQVIIDVIPALTQIIGPQPPIPELDSVATQNRFNLVFQNFVQALAAKDHPLVIFFDDLQWADSSSVKLLELLLKNIDSRYFLIIGAYRDNDIDALDPIITAIKGIRKAGIRTYEIVLKPLNLSHISNLLSDTLHMSAEKIAPLAEICFEKTHGNPFFLLQFLHELYKEQLIEFDTIRGQWSFQITHIQQKGFTDNVVEFMAKRVRELPTLTQNILHLAACLGSTFDVETLSIVAQQSTKQVSEDIWPAVQVGLIIPLDEAYKYAGDAGVKNAKYQFLHDRVLQAAYGLTSEKNNSLVQLTIGRLLLEHTPDDKLAENALNIINHYNMSLDLITSPKEKETIAELNLLAGQHAKNCVAYEQALSCLKSGIKLLSDDCWKTQYKLALALYTEAAETANLIKSYDEMEEWIEYILENGKTTLDKTKAYNTRCRYFLSQNRLLDTIDTGIIGFKALGVDLTKSPSKYTIIFEYLRSKWLLLGKTTETLYNQPLSPDPNGPAILGLSKSVMQAMYLSSPMLFGLFALKINERQFRNGMNPDLFIFTLVYGMVCISFNEVEKGYQFGCLGLRLFDKYNINDLKPFAQMVFHSVIAHWRQPISKSLEPLKFNFQKGLEVGDLVAAGNCAFSYIATMSYCGKELSSVIEEAEYFSHALLKIGDYTSNQYVITFWWLAMQLTGKTKEQIEQSAIKFDEEKLIKAAVEKNDNEALCLLYMSKTMRNYILENYNDAYQDAQQAVFYSELVKGKEYYYLSSLVYLANYHLVSRQEQRQILKKVNSLMSSLKKWSDESPSNYSHKYYLVYAEYSRTIGKTKIATEYYNLAISQANKNGFIQDEGIANELAAKFYLSLDQNDITNSYIARGYINNAYSCYFYWGATAKTKLLLEKYAHLINQKSRENELSDMLTSDGTTLSRTAYGSDLDLATVMKAAQAINKEIVLSDMLRKMMQILLENTGAQKGFFLMEKNSHWFIEAESSIDQEPKVLQSIPVEEFLPMSVLTYVIRSKKPLVIDDAQHNSQFSNDPYITQVQTKSILCVPLLNQGAITGVLYFENNLTEHAFLQERVELVNLLSSQIVTSLENSRLYNYMKEMNEAYYRFVPIEFLNLLKKKNIAEIQLGDQIQQKMSVLVCDIRNFTTISEKLTPRENIDFINSFLSCTEPVIAKNKGFIDKYIGDAIMALYPEDKHSDSAVKCSIALLQALDQFNKTRIESNLRPIRIGIGISSGLIMLGTIGDAHRMEGTVISDVVNTAFRVESLTKIYGIPILITQAVYDDLENPNHYCIRKIDTVFVKGKLQAITIYEVFDNEPEDIIALKSKTNDKFQEAIGFFQQKKIPEALNIFRDIVKLNPDDLPANLYLNRCQEMLSQDVMRKIT